MTDPITRAREALARHESQNVTDPFHFPLIDHLYLALRDLLAMVEAKPSDTDEREWEYRGEDIWADPEAQHRFRRRKAGPWEVAPDAE